MTVLGKLQIKKSETVVAEDACRGGLLLSPYLHVVTMTRYDKLAGNYFEIGDIVFPYFTDTCEIASKYGCKVMGKNTNAFKEPCLKLGFRNSDGVFSPFGRTWPISHIRKYSIKSIKHENPKRGGNYERY
jgi:hypothetical protein